MSDETRLITMNRGSAADWAAQVRVQEAGEPGYNSSTKETKIGDGSRSFANLPKLWTDENSLLPGSAYGQSLVWNGTAYVPSPDPAAMITYVSPDGEDNPLAGYDANHPVRTIAYALSLASSRKRATQKRIKLLPGTYPEFIDLANDRYAGLFLSVYADTPGTVTVGGMPWNDGARTDTVRTAKCLCKLTNLGIKAKTGIPAELGGMVVYAVNAAHLTISVCVIDASNTAGNLTGLGSNAFGRTELYGTRFKGNMSTVLGANGGGEIRVDMDNILDGDIALGKACVLAVNNGRVGLGAALANTGTLSGGKRYDAYQNGDISGIANIPTSSLAAGTVSTGGRAN